MSEITEYLNQCATLQALTSAQRSALSESCRLLNVSGGTTVFHESDRPRHVYLLAAGRVRICHVGESGKQSILLLVQSGHLFGELVICLPGACEERAETTEDSKILAIPAEALKQLIPENAQLSLDMMSLFAVRRRLMKRRLRCVLFQSTRDRIVSLLRELADSEGTPDANEIHIRPRLSHQDLASMIGVTRETVTLTLGQLRAEGLIRIDRRRIVICRPGRLT